MSDDSNSILTSNGELSKDSLPHWLSKAVTRVKIPVHLNCKIEGSYDDSSKMGFLEAILPIDYDIIPSIIYKPMYQETELQYSSTDCYPFLPLSSYFFKNMPKDIIDNLKAEGKGNLYDILKPLIEDPNINMESKTGEEEAAARVVLESKDIYHSKNTTQLNKEETKKLLKKINLTSTE